jgi:hypothetical protein
MATRDELKNRRAAQQPAVPAVSEIMRRMTAGVSLSTLTNGVHLHPDGTLALYGCTASPAGIEIPDSISADDIEKLARMLFNLEGHIQLFVGDMLNAAERLQYGFIAALAEEMGKDPATLTNWKSICKAVKTSLRGEVLANHPDKKPLSLEHYKCVWALEEDQQRHWLNLAMANEWSAKKLQAALKGTPALPDTSSPFEKKWHSLYTLLQKATPDEQRQMIQSLRQWLDEIAQHLPE